MTSPSLGSPARPAPGDTWAAPTAVGTLRATVDVPGSKSLTNRHLVVAALADGPSTISGALRSRDTDLMADALRSLGARIETDGGASSLRVTPGPITGPATIRCGLAGTVMRFLPAVAALADGDVRFDGDEAARARPMGPVLAGLRSLGVEVTDDDGGRPSTLPFTVAGHGGVVGGAVDLDASASSQFVSGLLLAAARFDRGLQVRHVGPTLPSLPHIEMTVAVLRDAGVTIDDSRPAIWIVEPGPIAARDVRMEPDLSNAAVFLASALVAGGSVSVPGWPTETTQAGALAPELLAAMGGKVRQRGDVMTVTGDGTIHGIDVDLHTAGELTPTIAALAALADSPSRLRGISHLRGHETDRLTALATEITRLGGRCEQTSDGVVIAPAPLHGAVVDTYQDHRMAMAAALVGLRVPGVQVRDVGTTAKTLPEFPTMWARMIGSAGTPGRANA